MNCERCNKIAKFPCRLLGTKIIVWLCVFCVNDVPKVCYWMKKYLKRKYNYNYFGVMKRKQ